MIFQVVLFTDTVMELSQILWRGTCHVSDESKKQNHQITRYRQFVPLHRQITFGSLDLEHDCFADLGHPFTYLFLQL